MELIREIVKQEIQQIINEGPAENCENHYDFFRPDRAAEYALAFAQKASELNEFYWHVANIATNIESSPEEKIALIKKLLPNFGWLG